MPRAGAVEIVVIAAADQRQVSMVVMVSSIVMMERTVMTVMYADVVAVRRMVSAYVMTVCMASSVSAVGPRFGCCTESNAGYCGDC